MASELRGKFKLISSEKFDDFMQKLGVGFAMRKLAIATSPTVTITITEDIWTIETHSAVKTTVVKFKLDETFDETTPDGRSVKSTFTLEDGKLVNRQLHTKPGEKDSEIVRYTEGDLLITTCTCEGVTALRKLKRLE